MYQNMTRAGLKGKYMEWLIEFIGGDYDRKQVLECRTMFGDDDLMSRLRTSSFDLAIEDFTHFCPIVQYLRKNMEIPFVAISLLSAIPSVACVINRWPFNPSYMPEMFTVLNHTMSFQERLFNTGWTLFEISVAKMIGNSYDGLRHDFGIADTTPFYDGAELYLINSHFSLDFPKPTLPNTVMVGGLTTRSGQLLDKVSTFFNDCTHLCSTSRLPVVLFVCLNGEGGIARLFRVRGGKVGSGVKLSALQMQCSVIGKFMIGSFTFLQPPGEPKKTAAGTQNGGSS